MAELFGHEKLKVYQKGMTFAVMRNELQVGFSRHVSACDHLDRASESILVNIAHASGSWYPKERVVYLGHANGSALECAACLDILVAKKLLDKIAAAPGKSILSEIVSMIIAMRKTASNRVREESVVYRTKKGCLFSHEDLDAYQTAIQLVAWLEDVNEQFSCSADLLSKLDKSTTAIALNIAEGTGRFTGKDQSKFFGIAYKSTVQSAALVDLATATVATDNSQKEYGLQLLRRIAAMLTSLSKVAKYDT